MDIQPQSTQPISDDQELAKVLAGVNADANEAEVTPTVAEMQPPVAPMGPPVTAPTPDPIMPAALTPTASPVAIPVAGELDGVKQAAITELRPLVDKLTLPPEEKFDTYLLLIRSTDDKSLISPAHEAAKMINDETRRAQALLDVIKEIDFLSGSQAA
jgi:hypothetical protein